LESTPEIVLPTDQGIPELVANEDTQAKGWNSFIHSPSLGRAVFVQKRVQGAAPHDSVILKEGFALLEDKPQDDEVETPGLKRSPLWKIKPASIRKHEIPALPAHIQSHDCLHN
jgi:hypothetical protein